MISAILSVLLASLALDLAVASTTNRAPGDTDPDDPEAEEPTGEQPDDETAPPSAGVTLQGSSDGDWLAGDIGDDALYGAEGADDIFGDLGHDTLDGGEGDDWLHGDGDYGEPGKDLLIGGRGNDMLAGDGGDDTLLGGPGNDTLMGGSGDDLLRGGPGNVTLMGHDGDDTLRAGRGESDLTGGAGDDLLIGSDDPSRAWLHGNEGGDTLVLGDNDFAEGGEGDDLFILPGEPGTTLPVIADFQAGGDLIEIRVAYPPGGPVPQLQLDHDSEGMTVIHVDGVALARVVGQGLQANHIVLRNVIGRA